ncbi:hypothetical protein [Sphingomonas bacterium]|uniref:hypothetical protein n=1 Tax=Sphingomonas bacterium TaxID=1895847 RepID=UPI001575C266|nr:hypothetical protein [Sphingomonas bacterium]
MALFGSGIWGVLVIVGPILLAAAIAWAALNNRQSKRAERRTEDATRELYQAEDAKNKEAGR